MDARTIQAMLTLRKSTKLFITELLGWLTEHLECTSAPKHWLEKPKLNNLNYDLRLLTIQVSRFRWRQLLYSDFLDDTDRLKLLRELRCIRARLLSCFVTVLKLVGDTEGAKHVKKTYYKIFIDDYEETDDFIPNALANAKAGIAKAFKTIKRRSRKQPYPMPTPIPESSPEKDDMFSDGSESP